MVFFVFAPLAFIVLSLSVKWPWKRIALAAVGIGLAADILLDFVIARRM